MAGIWDPVHRQLLLEICLRTFATYTDECLHACDVKVILINSLGNKSVPRNSISGFFNRGVLLFHSYFSYFDWGEEYD